jgi:hypothetical protein
MKSNQVCGVLLLLPNSFLTRVFVCILVVDPAPTIATKRSIGMSFDGRSLSDDSAAQLLDRFAFYLSNPEELLLVSPKY